MKRQTRNPKKLRRLERQEQTVEANFRNLVHDDLDGVAFASVPNLEELLADQGLTAISQTINGHRIILNKDMPKNQLMLVPTDISIERLHHLLAKHKAVIPVEADSVTMEELRNAKPISFSINGSLTKEGAIVDMNLDYVVDHESDPVIINEMKRNARTRPFSLPSDRYDED